MEYNFRIFVLVLVVFGIGVTGCAPQVTKSDAIYYGYCAGIYPYAEVAIQRSQLNFAKGSFEAVAIRAKRNFPAPIEWPQEMLEEFKIHMSLAQNHGGAFRRGNFVPGDIERLNGCINWLHDCPRGDWISRVLGT